ncbi:uncharacterized protein LOC108214672 isoform X2 [Daucus carota subsp. sativus]|uniref:uncharacterized protein LOC108214672 isoform X2 n=1 Tax=Daucus carota subsp. sativus TaxID=79200 RepID=UPI0007EF51F0|nr:PREDICTED: uncharacterized protein LOC108214672 isoform X2 [Daucus carota subsp. sativus]
MENGASDLAYKFAGLGINNNETSSDAALFQVMKAVEAAEATIKQQVEENNRLRSELLRKHHEIEKYKVADWTPQNPLLVDNWDGHAHGYPGIDRSNYRLANPTGVASSLNSSSAHGPSGTSGLRKEVTHNINNPVMHEYGENHFDSNKISEAQSTFPTGQTELPNGAISQRSSPSTTSISPRRYQLEGDFDRGRLMTMADIGDPGSSLKQELVVKARENDAEISQLRKHLAEYSVKEVQLHNENYVLEKRIAYMRMAFDQQQQELVDAASKAISYRQDIIEENIRLSYALQEAQQERSTFVSSLVPVIAEYFSPPPVADAQNIVSNLKVIFKHLQEQLIITESKLKESQYQIAPWHSDTNLTNFAQSPSHSLLQNELGMVPQPVYSKEELAPSGPLKDRNWDLSGDQESILNGGVAKNLETDEFGRYSALSRRNPASQVGPEQLTVSPSDSLPRNSEMTSNRQVKFSDTVSSIEMDDPDMEGQQIGRDPSANWSSRNSPYAADDHITSYSPYLPPVLEEPSSSFSEDDDPLPAVEGLQISGEPYPGQELQASGFSINGTTSCNFEWVRHLEDGSVNYIDGAKQPTYLVSADDVDNYLAIEVQPMDDRKRKGELVKVFANDNRKIACDPEMHNIIRRNLQAGQASYRISQSVGYLDMWESAILVVKKEGFNIKGTGSSTSLVTEKFSSATSVVVPCGHPTEFSIISGGVEYHLQAENSPEDITGARDTIVLTLRLFIVRAGNKKKGKKKVPFFK